MHKTPSVPAGSYAERFGYILDQNLKRLKAELSDAGCPQVVSLICVCPTTSEANTVVSPKSDELMAGVNTCALLVANGEKPRVIHEEDVKTYARKFNRAQDYLSDFIQAIHYVLNGNSRKTLDGVNGLAKLRQLHQRGYPR